jgi:hypothetical protein
VQREILSSSERSFLGSEDSFTTSHRPLGANSGAGHCPVAPAIERYAGARPFCRRRSHLVHPAGGTTGVRSVPGGVILAVLVLLATLVFAEPPRADARQRRESAPTCRSVTAIGGS